MLSIQQAHLFETEEENELAHAARGGGRSRRGGGRSRRAWGFGAAGVGAAAGGILLSRNRRVRGLVRKGYKTIKRTGLYKGAAKRVRKGIKSIKKTGAYAAVSSRYASARGSLSAYGAKVAGSRIGVAARGAYGRVKARVVKGYKSATRRGKAVARAASGRSRRASTNVRKYRMPSTKATRRRASRRK